MIKPLSECKELRQRIDTKFRNDADFEAFCIDNFPDVYRRFGAGMERTQKVNLLFSLVEVPNIAAKLDERVRPWSLPKQGGSWRWVAIGVALLAMAGGGIYAAFYRRDPSSAANNPGAVAPTTEQQAVNTSAVSAPIRFNSGNIILDSANAQLRNRAVSTALRDLGITINSDNRIQGSPHGVITNEVIGQ